MSDISPILSLPLLQPAQAQKHVTHNEALRILDVLVQPVVASRQTLSPPVLPVEGERFILPPTAGGTWAGHAGTIAFFDQGAWAFLPPQPGWQAHVLDEDTTATWTGSAWVTPADAPATFPQLGVNTTADVTNRLAVAAEATMLTHAGTGHQLKLNKATAGDTASLLFQTGWSGRAEMGTTGSDCFAIKTSADGSTWTTALQTTPATGRVELPAGVTLPTGSAATPSLTFTDDPDTGFLHVAENQIGFATGGVERLRLTSTGHLTGAAVQTSATDPVAAALDARLVRMDGLRTAFLSRGGRTYTALGAAANIDTQGAGASGLYDAALNGGTFPPFASAESGLWLITTEALYSAQSGPNGCLRQTAEGYRSSTVSPDTVIRCERIRSFDGAHWSSWVRLHHNRSVVGTVEQSGGIPTGAIIERGSNANGQYVRFADGTQLCMSQPGLAVVLTAQGAIAKSDFLTLTWPAAFVSGPRYIAASINDGAGVNTSLFGIKAASGNLTTLPVQVWGTATGSFTVYAGILAVGRWF